MSKWLFLFGIVGALSACSFSGKNQAPIEVVNPKSVGEVAVQIKPVVTTPPPLNAEFADKPGYYTVQPGDTLFAIARKYQQKVSDLVAWNQLNDPNVIEINDVLRVFPPNAISQGVGVAGSSTVEAPSVAQVTAAGSGGAARAETPLEPIPTQAPVWAWPAAGKVVQVFEDNPKEKEDRIRGLDIENVLGTPIFAAADGVVAVAQTQRGYGPLVVIRHGDNFLSAYAHNQVVLVKEGDVVKAGQKIATMGSEDTDGPKLFFQIRKEFKSVDPLLYLPQQ